MIVIGCMSSLKKSISLGKMIMTTLSPAETYLWLCRDSSYLANNPCNNAKVSCAD